VRVNGANQLFDGRLEPQRERGLGDQLGRSQADHVHAEDLVVLLVGDDLDEPFRLARHLRAAEHAERERADAHVVAPSDGGLLREADAADLGIAVGAARHVIVVDRGRLVPAMRSAAMMPSADDTCASCGMRRAPSVITSPMAETPARSCGTSLSTLM
jgi:hypothetical protein